MRRQSRIAEPIATIEGAWTRIFSERVLGAPFSDALLASVLLVADLSEINRIHALLAARGEIAALPVIIAIAVARAGALTLRRRFPLTVSVLISATLISVPTEGLSHLWRPAAAGPDAGWWPSALGYTGALEALVAVYTVTALRGRPRGAVAAAWFVIATLPWIMPQILAVGPAPIVLVLIIATLAFHLGDVRGRVVAARSDLAESARRINIERGRAKRAAVDLERERLARELQGLVARNLRQMIDEAGAAMRALQFSERSAAPLEAIGALERTGRAALTDARRALGLLRPNGLGAPLLPVGTAGIHPSGIDQERAQPRPRERASTAMTTGEGGLADAAVVASILIFLVSEIGVIRGLPPHKSLGLIMNPLDLAAIVVLTFPLAFRRRYPLPTALLLAAGFFVHAVGGQFFGLAELMALLIGVYSVWAERGPTQGLIAAVTAGAVIPAAADVLVTAFGFPLITLYLPFLSGACFLGWQERMLRLTTVKLADQEIELQRIRDAGIERARTEERLRIARELHDVTAHTLSVMTVQAGAARTVASSKPEQALRALSAVENTGRRAQAELEKVFANDALRAERQSDGTPAIGSLPALALQMADAGLDVELDVGQPPSRMTPGLELSLYRVVQEALTNAAKHAGPTRVHVRMRCDSAWLVLEVEDEGRPGPDISMTIGPRDPRGNDVGGRGLIGMRERVRAFGGTLTTRPRHNRGFVVTVRVPLSNEASFNK